MKPFGTLDGGVIAQSLHITDRQLAQIIASESFPAPDAAVCQLQNPAAWAWNASTAGTAIAALSPADIEATLLRANSPTPDGSPAIKPYQAPAVFNNWL